MTLGSGMSCHRTHARARARTLETPRRSARPLMRITSSATIKKEHRRALCAMLSSVVHTHVTPVLAEMIKVAGFVCDDDAETRGATARDPRECGGGCALSSARDELIKSPINAKLTSCLECKTSYLILKWKMGGYFWIPSNFTSLRVGSDYINWCFDHEK